MGKENDPKSFIRLPNSWGMKAAGRIDERVSNIHNRLGFDPNKSWNLFSIETYSGTMENLYKYANLYLRKAINSLAYQDRTTILWSWPLPGDSSDSESKMRREGESKESKARDSTKLNKPIGILRILHLPPFAETPDDLVRLELIDVHSQLLGRIGFEFLRFQELLSVWKFTAEQKQYIGTASMSRVLIEAAASLYRLGQNLADQWTKCKTTSGKIYETSTGGRVDRERAVEVEGLRKLLWSSRNELKLHDFKDSGLDESLGEWRNPELFELMEYFDIQFRLESTVKPDEVLSQLVRELDRRITLTNTTGTLKKDYELLCNIVHPSIGSFQLFSGLPLSDPTYGFNNIAVGKNRGRARIKSEDPSINEKISPYGVFGNAISESMFIAGNIYLSILEWMTTIGDDIALTANIEPLSFYKTWRYPRALKGVECLCTWKEIGGCDHSWGAQGPQLPSNFEIDLRLTNRRR